MHGQHRANWILVGDVGGTNARFAFADDENRLHDVQTRMCAEYPSLEAAVSAYLIAAGRRAERAVLAVAGPVIDGAIDVTNLGWRTSERDLAHACDLDHVHICNDYAALAHAAPRLEASDLHWVGGPQTRQSGTVLVLGPGTGFGAAALVREGATSAASVGEAGHIAFAPTDQIDREILNRLGRRHGRVSIERILSGRGLGDLHTTLCGMAGVELDATEAADVTAAASRGDALALRTVERFCAILGSVAGDLALSFGARGGVLIAGGIAPRLLHVLGAGSFRARFEDKGRFEAYMRGIATNVVVHPYPALIGAAALSRGGGWL